MNKLKKSLLSIVIGLVLAAGLSYAASWTGPTANPPNDNADAPINIGSATQVKGGSLGVDGFSAFSKAIFYNTIQIKGGAPGEGKFLISDAAGNARWCDINVDCFVPANQYLLEVKIPSGLGLVKDSGGSTNDINNNGINGINCEKRISSTGKEELLGVCSLKINEGTLVILSPFNFSSKPYVFSKWSGGCENGSGAASPTCLVKMDGDKTISATFEFKKGNYKYFSVLKAGLGDGRVIGSGINCGNDCGEYLYYGGCVENLCPTIPLKAIPDEGSVFRGWIGCVAGYGPKDTCDGSIDGQMVTAIFDKK